LLQCCHPLEALEWNAVGVRGDAEGDDPPVDSDGNCVTVGTAALSLMKFGGDAGERHGPSTSPLGQRRGVDVEPTTVDHPANLAARAEDLDRPELGQSQV
jgi:hypothetical protein